MSTLSWALLLFLVIAVLVLTRDTKKVRKSKPLTSFNLARKSHVDNRGRDALKYYFKSFQGGNVCVLMDIAKIYHYGLHDVEPNIERAKQTYKLFLDMSQNIELKNKTKYREEAVNKLAEIEDIDTGHEKDYYKFMTNYDNYLDVLTINDTTDAIDGDTYEVNTIATNLLNDINAYELDTVETFQPIRLVEQPVQRIEIPPDTNNNPLIVPHDEQYFNIYNDPQNIHDTFVNNTVTNAINTMKVETKQKYDYNEIKHLLGVEIAKLPKDKQNNINRVLQKVETCTIFKNDKSLKDVLTIVGNRIYCSQDNEYKRTGIENLLNELNDSIENNNVVCFSGVHNRIVDSLNLLDPKVNIQSKETLSLEMLNKCSAIRTELEKTLSANDASFDDKLKDKIQTQLKKDYVDSKILKQDELDNIVNEWIEYV